MSVSLSSCDRLSSPLMTWVPLCWARSCTSTFLCWGTQQRTQHSSTGQQKSISTLSLQVMLSLTQPRVLLAFAAGTVSRFILSFRTPRPFLQSWFTAGWLQPILVPGVVPPQGQDLMVGLFICLVFFIFNVVSVGLFLLLSPASPALWIVTTQLVVDCFWTLYICY